MLTRLMHFFRGNVTLYIPQSDAERFLALLLGGDIPAITHPNDGENGLYAELSPKHVKKLAPALDKLKIKVYIINVEGCCTLLSALRYRLGSVFGAAALVLLVWLSTLIIWRVDIVGADSIPAHSLRLRLSELGVGVGCRISEIDTLEVGNAFLLAYPELSWVSLDITGTTATLTVRETVPPKQEAKSEGYLLVASEAGIVESVRVYSGAATVSPGSVVKKGDVLISGLISGSGLQYTDKPILRIGNASGSVVARVERSVSVSVPLEEDVYSASGAVTVHRAVSILGRSFSIGARSRDAECSETVRRYNVTLFGIVELPIEVTETTRTEYTLTHITRTEDEAARRADTLARMLVSDAVGDGELLWLRLTETQRDGICTAYASYCCTAEIARIYSRTPGGDNTGTADP